MVEAIKDSQAESCIRRLYKGGLSVRGIARETRRSTTYVTKVLMRSGDYVYADGSVSSAERDAEHVTGIGRKLVAVCRKTGKKFDDFRNSAGTLTRHIQSTFQEAVIPHNWYDRKSMELTDGSPWWRRFMDVVEVNDDDFYKPKKKCRYCDWTTYDTDNKSGAYTSHVFSEHGKTIDEYTREFPDETELFPTHMAKRDLEEFVNSSLDNFIICRECGDKMMKITNTHLKYKHGGMTLKEYRDIHGSTLSENSRKILSKNTTAMNLSIWPKREGTSLEAMMEEFIKKANVAYVKQKPFKGFFYDFFLPDHGIFIEADGAFWHGHDRKSGWVATVIGNVLNDLKKSESAPNVFRLVEKKSVNLENLALISGADSLFDFIRREHFDIKSHRIFNLSVNDAIMSEDYLRRNAGTLQKTGIERNIVALMERFYSPDRVIKLSEGLSSNRAFSSTSLFEAVKARIYAVGCGYSDLSVRLIYDSLPLRNQ